MVRSTNARSIGPLGGSVTVHAWPWEYVRCIQHTFPVILLIRHWSSSFQLSSRNAIRRRQEALSSSPLRRSYSILRFVKNADCTLPSFFLSFWPFSRLLCIAGEASTPVPLVDHPTARSQSTWLWSAHFHKLTSSLKFLGVFCCLEWPVLDLICGNRFVIVVITFLYCLCLNIPCMFSNEFSRLCFDRWVCNRCVLAVWFYAPVSGYITEGENLALTKDASYILTPEHNQFAIGV